MDTLFSIKKDASLIDWRPKFPKTLMAAIQIIQSPKTSIILIQILRTPLHVELTMLNEADLIDMVNPRQMVRYPDDRLIM